MTEVVTLGCRLNLAESEAIRALLPDTEDLIVVNSCAVTNEAVRQTRQAIRRAHRDRPRARIVVTGCAAQIDPASFAAMPEVARVVGNAEKLDAKILNPNSVRAETMGAGNPNSVRAELVEALLFPSSEPGERTGLRQAQPSRGWEHKVSVSDIFSAQSTAPHLVSGFASHARAFVEVQTGCDHRCTFCIIPYGRGNSRAAPAAHVIERIRTLVDDGYREVVLTGVDLTSHPDLAGLIESILREAPALPRLRLSSLDPAEVDDRLFALITGEPRIMPHVHLSLQSGEDMILKRMKRRHSRAQAVALVQRLKAARPDIAIGADLIAGFPTETDDMFANSLRVLEDCEVVFGHIFPFSPRDGTPAARMPQVERALVKERAKMLRERASQRQAAWLKSLVGTRQRVLIELDGVSGHAENFAQILTRHPRESGDPAFPSSSSAPPRLRANQSESEPRKPTRKKVDSRFRRNDAGAIIDVTITAATPTTLIAEPTA